MGLRATGRVLGQFFVAIPPTGAAGPTTLPLAIPPARFGFLVDPWSADDEEEEMVARP